jgi:hypothetical protein
MTNTDTNAPYSNLERDILTKQPSFQRLTIQTSTKSTLETELDQNSST